MKYILGIDEAGRGPVVGPMVIAGVLLEKASERKLKRLGVRDSKMLSPARRRELRKKILDEAVEFHCISISPHRIDSRKVSLNELEAQVIAELLKKFRHRIDHIYIDLPDPSAESFINRIKKYIDVKSKITAEHKADLKYPVVGAASIIAKTERDKRIKEYEKKYGKIGSGYPSDPRTIKFLKKNINLPIIRKSWSTTQRLKEKGRQRKIEDWF
ncbi:ribonuclease HII [Candidatus Micrarchaeota archaeon]|nr:MAG: ribonuclease HII [Candidatus Micrarchaeota archaeon]